MELVGGHSHDSAEQVDAALEADARGRRALWLSLVALAVTALLQGTVVAVTGSVALLGDTLQNVADAATALPLLLAFRLARKPPNDRFTYGYGRAEDLAGVFVVVMIALSSLVAGYEAINRLLHPQAVSHLWAVIALAILSVLRSAVVQVGARLMDAVSPDLVTTAREAIATVDGVVDIRDLRLRWIGHTLRAEADLGVGADLPMKAAHDIAHHAEEHLLERLPRLGAAVIHVSLAR